MRRKTIVLDTNFLMIPAEFKVDIYTELERVCDFPYKLAWTDGIIKELKRLEDKGSYKERKAAKLAIEIAKSKNLNTLILGASNVDESLLKLNNKGYIIATQDKELQKRLKSFIYLRQKKYLKIKD